MKNKYIIIYGGAALLVMLGAVSCVKDKSKEVAQENTQLGNNSYVQVYNGIVNSNRVYMYVDATAVNGATIGYGTTFPATPSSFSITSGFREFLVKDTSSTAVQPQVEFGQNLQPSANYTIFLYDTMTSPKTKTVYNSIIKPTDTTARLRFANFIYNPGALTSGFDIFSVKRNAVIFSNVRETEVTEFIPYASAVTDTFYIRLNGSTTNLQNVDPSTTGGPTITDVFAVLTPTRLRSYTLIWRGGYRSYASRTAGGTAIAMVRTLSAFTTY